MASSQLAMDHLTQSSSPQWGGDDASQEEPGESWDCDDVSNEIRQDLKRYGTSFLHIFVIAATIL